MKRPGPLVTRTAMALAASAAAATGILAAEALEARRRIGRRTTAPPMPTAATDAVQG